MPRRDRDGEAQAARASAEGSLEDAVLDLSDVLSLLPMTPAEKAAEQRSKARDMAHFQAHPDTLSYVRPYHPGEVAAVLLLPYGGRQPEAVAVALVCPGRRARVFIWPGMLRGSARRWAEEAARRDRARLGLAVNA